MEKHNQFDNIDRIRLDGYPTEEQIIGVLNRPTSMRQVKIGRTIILRDVAAFIQTINRSKSVKIPIWKIVLPRLGEWTQGAIYYIVETNNGNLAFRGTYGYCGTGPHESALVEAYLEKAKYRLEVRDGDYLLEFFYPTKKETPQ